MYISHKKISSKPAEKTEKFGRGQNGMAFVYNSDISITAPIQFFGNRIATMELHSVVIIGVYMIFNDNYPESYEELNSDLKLLSELAKTLGKNKEVIIIGDFNIDLSKRNRFTIALIKLLSELDFIVADIEYGPQKCDYTWHSIRYDGDKKPYIISSWVDHVLVKRYSKLINYIEIIASGSNEGDHNSIRLTLKSDIKVADTIILKSKNFKPNLNWNVYAVSKEYSDKVEHGMAKLNTVFQSLKKLDPNNENVIRDMTNAHSLFNDTLVNAKSRIINLYAYTKKPKKKYGIRKYEIVGKIK
jgi:hypothetical protein